MKRITTVFLILIIMMIMIFLPISSNAEGGLLPSLTETVGIAMPSLGEALERYPDSETENGDSSVTELYTNVSEEDFNTFSVYLEKQEAELADYKVEKGILTAEIRAKGASFNLQYDSKTGEAKVTYPEGTFAEWTKIAKNHYDAGKKLLDSGKMDEAVEEFLSIPQFRKYGAVAELLQKDENLAAAIFRRMYRERGNVVIFGTYTQTGGEVDQTPIEWIVLDYDEANNKALLFSRYGLDAVPYHKDLTDITWDKCSLRSWLNGEFLSKAFSAAEKSAILITNVDNGKSQGYKGWNSDGGTNTKDQIFLLSYAEANRYLGVTYEDKNNVKSRVAPTAYALAQGAWTSDSNKTEEDAVAGWWWLRSSGEKQTFAAGVRSDGSLNDFDVNSANRLVRPALWLNLDSDIF